MENIINIINNIPHAHHHSDDSSYHRGVYSIGSQSGSFSINKESLEINRFGPKEYKDQFQKDLNELIERNK